VEQTINVRTLDNGLILVAESMPWLESAAMSLHVPCGCVFDPVDRLGLANLTCEMVQRGCGAHSSRQFVERLESLGVDHSASVSAMHTTYMASMMSERLPDALGMYADLVRRPHLPEKQLDDARLVCLHEIRSIDDDFAQMTHQRLRLDHYGHPLGRNAAGVLDHVERATIDDVRAFFAGAYGATGAILAVAGRFDWESLAACVERHFGGWTPHALRRMGDERPCRGRRHLEHDTNQTHIAIACPGVPYNHADYFLARGAVGVLSDGVSSRFFLEIREHRALCYAVSAYCHSFLDRGSVLCYAGTTAERAQETLDVMLAELDGLNRGVRDEELARVKARIKSGLIMQQESSGARASSIAGDWYYWGRVRTLDELKSLIDGLTARDINAFLDRHPFRPVTIVTLGEKELEADLGVS